MSRRTKAQLREDYLRWLENQLRDEADDNGRTYWGLTNFMFDTPFIWSIPMDDNRLRDGLDLRWDFAREQGISVNPLERFGPCSFLEVLIGLSRRLAFISGGSAPGWAWQLLSNLELHRMSDPLTASKQGKSEEIMRMVMERTYSPDGTGGFFPLAWPDDDQTQIELWYQMNAYAWELHPEHR